MDATDIEAQPKSTDAMADRDHWDFLRKQQRWIERPVREFVIRVPGDGMPVNQVEYFLNCVTDILCCQFGEAGMEQIKKWAAFNKWCEAQHP